MSDKSKPLERKNSDLESSKPAVKYDFDNKPVTFHTRVMIGTGHNADKAKVASGENVFADSRDPTSKFENSEKSKSRGALPSDVFEEAPVIASNHSGKDFNSIKVDDHIGLVIDSSPKSCLNTCHPYLL